MTFGKRYVVTFYKTVATSSGHEREIKQHEIEVFAKDKDDALERAKAEMCRLEGLSDWEQHADRCEIEQPEFPS